MSGTYSHRKEMAPALETNTKAVKLPERITSASFDMASKGNGRGQFGLYNDEEREQFARIVEPERHEASAPLGGTHLSGNRPMTNNRSSEQRVTPSMHFYSISPNVNGGNSDKSLSSQHFFLKTTRTSDNKFVCVRTSQTLNKPPPLDNKEGTCRELTGLIRSHEVSNRTTGDDVNILTLDRQASGPNQLRTQGTVGPNSTHDEVLGRKTEIPSNFMLNLNPSSEENMGQVTNLGAPTPKIYTFAVVQGHSPHQSPVSRPSVFNDKLQEAKSKQKCLESQVCSQKKRLIYLQGQHVFDHAQQQLSAYVKYQQQCKRTAAESASIATQQSENSLDLEKELVSDRAKRMSATALVNLVEKMQSSGSYAKGNVIKEGSLTQTMMEDDRKNSKVVVEKLSSTVHDMQHVLDSDYSTASSCDEESDDEPNTPSVPLPSTPLNKRAEWKWLSERSSVLSKFNWLHSKVADMEYNIRKMTEIYRAARRAKGPVLLDDQPRSLQVGDAAVFQAVAQDDVDQSSIFDDPSCRAARCFPLRSQLRRRKLVKTSDLDRLPDVLYIKKAKLSSVKCQCNETVTPCVLCARTGETCQTIDPDGMSLRERVALLDPSFHPVLSFQEEVPLSIHFEKLVRSSRWEVRSPVRQPRKQQPGQRKQTGSIVPSIPVGRNLLQAKAASVTNQSAKPATSFPQSSQQIEVALGKKLGKKALKTEIKRRQKAVLGIKTANSKEGKCSKNAMGTIPVVRKTKIKGRPGRKKGGVRRQNAYEAYCGERFEIPTIMTSRRVEDLKYEQIVTPGWRSTPTETQQQIDLPADPSDDLPAMEIPVEEEIEDLSDECFIRRHQACELMEKRKFAFEKKEEKEGRRRGRPPRKVQQSTTSHDSSHPNTPGDSSSLKTCASSVDSGCALFRNGEGLSQQSLNVTINHSDGSVTPWDHDQLAPSDRCSAVKGGVLVGCDEPSGSPCSGEMSSQDTSETGDSVVLPWPRRKFPLSDEEFKKLEEEATEASSASSDRSRTVANIQSLESDALEGDSLAGSSVYDSLPPSPSSSFCFTPEMGDSENKNHKLGDRGELDDSLLEQTQTVIR